MCPVCVPTRLVAEFEVQQRLQESDLFLPSTTFWPGITVRLSVVRGATSAGTALWRMHCPGRGCRREWFLGAETIQNGVSAAVESGRTFADRHARRAPPRLLRNGPGLSPEYLRERVAVQELTLVLGVDL